MRSDHWLGQYRECFFWKFDDLQITQDMGGEAIVAFCRDPDEQNFHPDNSGRLIVFEVMQVLLDVEGSGERKEPEGLMNLLMCNDAVRNIFKQNIPRIAWLLGDLRPWQTLGEEGAALLSRLAAQSVVDQKRLADEQQQRRFRILLGQHGAGGADQAALAAAAKHTDETSSCKMHISRPIDAGEIPGPFESWDEANCEWI